MDFYTTTCRKKLVYIAEHYCRTFVYIRYTALLQHICLYSGSNRNEKNKHSQTITYQPNNNLAAKQPTCCSDYRLQPSTTACRTCPRVMARTCLALLTLLAGPINFGAMHLQIITITLMLQVMLQHKLVSEAF